MRRERSLTIFGLLVLALTIPALIAMGIDDRTLRGVNVWVKPIKFLAATGVLSFTTAWFIGLLPTAVRQSPSIRTCVWTILIIGTVENSYIALQAAQGAASHYNTSSVVHAVIYSLMGVGALLLTLTQAILGFTIARHASGELNPVWKTAVVWGLMMTFFLGASAGTLLGSAQPPSGMGIPFLGWHVSGGDLRPAHFIGMHAAQIIPIAGLLLAGDPRRSRARVKLYACILAYSGLWLAAMLIGIDGADFRPPSFPI